MSIDLEVISLRHATVVAFDAQGGVLMGPDVISFGADPDVAVKAENLIVDYVRCGVRQKKWWWVGIGQCSNDMF